MSSTSTKQEPKPNAASKPKATAPQLGPREGSTMWAAMEVLRGKRKPMTAAEIYAEVR